VGLLGMGAVWFALRGLKHRLSASRLKKEYAFLLEIIFTKQYVETFGIYIIDRLLAFGLVTAVSLAICFSMTEM
jgi:hypothetical protein